MALPYQGLMNQINCQIRAMAIADDLNATYVEVPLLHAINGEFMLFPLSQYLKFPCRRKVQWSALEPQKVELILHGRWNSPEMLGPQSAFFLSLMTARGLPINVRQSGLATTSSYTDFKQLLLKQRRVAVFANLQHVKFGSIAHPILNAVTPTKQLMRSYRSAVTCSKQFSAIHWRRGDFAHACKKNKDYDSCWPEVSALQPLGSSEPTFVCTNTDDPGEILSQGKGIRLVAHSKDPVSNLLVDFLVMVNAIRFRGNRYSSISRNVNVIRSGLHKNTEFFYLPG